MQRRDFLRRTIAVSAGLVAVPASTTRAADGGTAARAPSGPELDEPFLTVLVAANEAQVPGVLDTYAAALVAVNARSTARSVRRLTSAYVTPRSRYHHDPALVGPMREMTDALERVQHADGTFDSGSQASPGNLHSPPDSGFGLQDLCLVWTLLHEDGQAETRPITAALERILRKAGPALATGGVHTPNHRWEVCAALARINRLFPDRSYVARVEDWLDEGMEIDDEGHYSERSSTYASEVINPCLLTIARLLGKHTLIRHVRHNLQTTLYLLEPNGDVETVHSRRQDQVQVRDIWWYLLQYRELALLDRNPQFATVAKLIESRGVGELGDFLAEVLEQPELAAVLPRAGALPDRYTKLFRNSDLARLRRGATTASVFGGTDFHDIPAIASGLATNPTFFRMRKGAAILDSVRLSPRFFSTGHFRSDGLEVRGSSYRLHDQVEVPYHLPLPRRHRRRDGDYALTNDGRFYSKMDFPHRPKQFRVLRTEVLVVERDGAFDLQFALDQSEVPFTLELCFRPGGTLSGVQPAGGADNYQLVDGFGSYSVGEDRIEFGPGNGAGPLQPVSMDPGERYTYLGGGLVPPGVRVYITGRTPIRYVMRLR